MYLRNNFDEFDKNLHARFGSILFIITHVNNEQNHHENKL